MKVQFAQHHIAKPAYFGRKPIFEFINDRILGKDQIKPQKWDDNQLINGIGMVQFEAAKLLHIHIHEGFPAFGDALNKMIAYSSVINDDKYKWILIDLRDNFGGSLALLYLLIIRLFGNKALKAFSSCSSNSFVTNPSILKFYIDQFILPILSDPAVSASVKK